jgi:hypothetical protein
MRSVVSVHKMLKKNDLQNEIFAFQCGFAYSMVNRYKVTNIKVRHWNEFIKLILQFKKQSDAGETTFKYQADIKVIQMIKMAKVAYNENWIDRSLAFIRRKSDGLAKIGTWYTEDTADIGRNLNETVVEFLA